MDARPVGSNINAQNIKISSKKDTTIQGSNLNATKDITIEADNLNILASSAKTTSYSDSKTESLSIGISVDNENKANLGGVTGSLSKNKSESESITNTNSTLNAGGNLKVTTANDLTIKGGVVKADTVDLTVGNNLTIESVQDAEKSNNSSFSASLIVSTGSANGSLNMQKGYVDNAWVNEQSGITATNGGSIKVANNTDIKGAIIASDNKDKAIEIDTKTFTYENIKDKQEGKTTGFGISGGTTGGVPATSVQYASNDKRQDTNATLSNVSLTVNGEKVDPNTIGINTDLSQAQVITKDERIDMIDVNLQTDLANKEERDKIRDAKDKVEDVAKTVENVIDKGNVGGIKENYVNNRFATRGANAVEDDPTLSKMLNELKSKNLSEDEAKEVIIATVKKMYEANGFTGVPDIKFEAVVNGNTIGARGEETGTIYINVEKVIKDMGENGVGSLVGLIAHESSHSEKYTETTGIKGIEEDFADSKGDLANKKYDGTNKLLDTEKKDKDGLTEREKALKELNKNFADELAYSESLEVDSFNEEVEGYSGEDNVNAALQGKTVKEYRLEKAKEAIKNKASKEDVKELLKTLWDFGPGGNITGLVEAVYGKDLVTKEDLNLLTRLLSVVGATELAKGGKLTKEIVEKAIKNDKELQVLSQKTGIDLNLQLFGSKVDDIKDTGKVVGKKADDIYINLASDKRTQHILFGDATGGGHIWPGAPGKSAFPKNWSSEKIMNEVSEVVTDPNIKWSKNKVIKGVQRYETIGVKEGVKIKIITDGKDIITAYPIK